MRNRTAPLRSFAKRNGRTAQRAAQEDCGSCGDSKAPSTQRGLSAFRSRARVSERITAYQSDGWIVLGGSMQVSPSDPWTPGQSVDVSFTMENFTGENFCTTRAITAEGLERTSFQVCASQGGTATVSETITIPDFPEQQFTSVTISVEGSTESVTGSVETADGGGDTGGVTGSLTLSNVRLERSPTAGEEVRLIVDVTNETTEDATFDIEYSLNGQTADTESISGAFAHPPGSTLQYSGSITPTAGTNEACVTLSNVSAGGTSIGSAGPECMTFNAEEVSAGQPNVSVDRFTVPQGPLSPGENITVDVTFQNTGDADGQASSSVLFNGSLVGTASTQVPAGSTASASVTAPVPDTSELTVSVQGFADTITRAVGGTGDGEQPPTDGEQGGVGLGALLAGLAAIIFVAFGRN